MPATPAWPPASTPRLFIDETLSKGALVPLEGNQAHYLANVMRAKPGDPVRLFDNQTGEWLAEVQDVAKRRLTLAVVEKLSEKETVPDFWLVAAPIKKGRIDWVIEKACELGVAEIHPVITQRTIVDKINPERLAAHMIEAAEQCGRTALPILQEPIKLAQRLKDWPADRTLYFADENGGIPMREAIRAGEKAALLIGPEGGFTPEERSLILAHPQARGISLGPRILRAETAALAATGLWMGLAGDWTEKPVSG